MLRTTKSAVIEGKERIFFNLWYMVLMLSKYFVSDNYSTFQELTGIEQTI